MVSKIVEMDPRRMGTGKGFIKGGAGMKSVGVSENRKELENGVKSTHVLFNSMTGVSG